MTEATEHTHLLLQSDPNQFLCWASPVAQTVKALPVIQEIWVRSLGQEDPLEKGMATHSGALAWRIPWTEEPRGIQSMGSKTVGHNQATTTFTFK